MGNQVKEVPIHLGNTKTIDAGIGMIRWSSNNLQLIDIMEAVEEALKTISPLEIVRRING
jgi:glycerate kinase